MKNSINLPEVLSISTDECLENLIIVTDENEHEFAIEYALTIIENLNIINDFNLNEEEVAVDMYYCDENSHRHEEVEKTEWFNTFDFINDLSLDQGQQILQAYIKQEQAAAAAEEKEQKESILEAFACSSRIVPSEAIAVELKKNSEGDIHFEIKSETWVSFDPDSSKVVIHQLQVKENKIHISGTFVS